MSKLLKHDWSDDTVNWLEEDMQQAIIMRMRQRKDHGELFRIVGDMNAAKRTKALGARLKAAGMQTGETDMRIYMNYATTYFVELKRTGNPASPEQVSWHLILNKFGFDVWIVTARNPDDAVAQMHSLMDELIERTEQANEDR